MLQMKDVGAAGEVSLTGAAHIHMPGASVHELKPGDVIFKARGHVNSAGVVPSLSAPTITAAPLMVIRIRSAAITAEYLQWYINHPTVQSRLSAAATGSYIPTVGKRALEDLVIELPPLGQQIQIVAAARLADQEQELIARIASKRRDMTDRVLGRFTRTPDGTSTHIRNAPVSGHRAARN